MAGLRIFLTFFLVMLLVYTADVITHHGMGLLPVFFGAIGERTWPGQFNLDFFGFLLLSGAWVAWRNGFSPAGLALALVAVFGGMGFLTIYLLVESLRARTVLELLAGPRLRKA